MSPAAALTVTERSVEPSTSLLSTLHAPQVICFVCLPKTLVILPALESYRSTLPFPVASASVWPPGSHAQCVNSFFASPLSSLSASLCLGRYTVAASAANASFLPCSRWSTHSFSPRASHAKCVAAACVFSSVPARGISSCNAPWRSKICRRSAVPLTARYCPFGDHACVVGPEPSATSKSSFIARVHVSAKARVTPSRAASASPKKGSSLRSGHPRVVSFERSDGKRRFARALGSHRDASLASGRAPRAAPTPARDGPPIPRNRRAPPRGRRGHRTGHQKSSRSKHSHEVEPKNGLTPKV